jgi:F-type H+-transporting ATPase subunit beta
MKHPTEVKKPAHASGAIRQVIGPVVDVDFGDALPPLYTALVIDQGKSSSVTLEVQQHVGSGVVRAVAMGPTDGLYRGQVVASTGQPITSRRS